MREGSYQRTLPSRCDRRAADEFKWNNFGNLDAEEALLLLFERLPDVDCLRVPGSLMAKWR